MSKEQKKFFQPVDQLPDSLPIFPLHGVVLLPGAILPLNIFEPRYLNMVEDAMRNNRLIGMIQNPQETDTEELSEVGCAGRISHHEKTSDGQIRIVLTGSCRFKISQELPCLRGYRIIQPDWTSYTNDFEKQDVSENSVIQFRKTLKQYLSMNHIEADWNALEKLEVSELVNNLVMVLPMDASDKQLLVESSNLEKRVKLFTSLMNVTATKTDTRH